MCHKETKAGAFFSQKNEFLCKKELNVTLAIPVVYKKNVKWSWFLEMVLLLLKL